MGRISRTLYTLVNLEDNTNPERIVENQPPQETSLHREKLIGPRLKKVITALGCVSIGLGGVAYGLRAIKSEISSWVPDINVKMPEIDAGPTRLKIAVTKPVSQVYTTDAAVSGVVNGSFDMNMTRIVPRKGFFDCKETVVENVVTYGRIDSTVNDIKIITNHDTGNGKLETFVVVQPPIETASFVDYDKDATTMKTTSSLPCNQENDSDFVNLLVQVNQEIAKGITECSIEDLYSNNKNMEQFEADITGQLTAMKVGGDNPIRVELSPLDSVNALPFDWFPIVDNTLQSINPQLDLKSFEASDCKVSYGGLRSLKTPSLVPTTFVAEPAGPVLPVVTGFNDN